jgi:hypothetical protein
MNAERLLEHFYRVGDAAGAISRLRRCILIWRCAASSCRRTRATKRRRNCCEGPTAIESGGVVRRIDHRFAPTAARDLALLGLEDYAALDGDTLHRWKVSRARQRLGFGWRQSPAMASSVQDQIGDLVRMRDQRQMTGLNLDRLGLHPIGHEALQLGRDRPVFRGDGVPTRLRPPGRLSRLPRKQGVRDASLHGVEDACPWTNLSAKTSSLPVLSTRLIGREKEVSALVDLHYRRPDRPNISRWVSRLPRAKISSRASAALCTAGSPSIGAQSSIRAEVFPI